jgi:glyoxylate reductase
MKVLITREIPKTAHTILKKHPSISIVAREGAPLTEAELIEAVKDVDAMIAVIPDKINNKVLEAAPLLKIVAHYAVGYDNIDLATATRNGIYVTNTPGNLTETVAEFTLGLMLAIGKKLVEADQYTRDGQYKYWDPMVFLSATFWGKTIGIVGMGRIGLHLAKMAKHGFNMQVLYYDNQRNDTAEKELGAIYTSLDDLLEKSDFVSLHVPLLPSTQHLISSRELKKMKPTAFLINTSRGPVVEEDALYVALRDKWIEGAAIDVFEKEPEMYKGLRELSNVILTPHIASATREARIQMAKMAADNIIEVLINKRPPLNLVNTDVLGKARA